jgi:hypothetical protein
MFMIFGEILVISFVLLIFIFTVTLFNKIVSMVRELIPALRHHGCVTGGQPAVPPRSDSCIKECYHLTKEHHKTQRERERERERERDCIQRISIASRKSRASASQVKVLGFFMH